MEKTLFIYTLIIIALLSLTSCSNSKTHDSQVANKNQMQQPTKSNGGSGDDKKVPQIRDFETLSIGISRTDIISQLGKPTQDIGSGLPIYVYELGDGRAAVLNFTPDDKLSKLTIRGKGGSSKVLMQSLAAKVDGNLDKILGQSDKSNDINPINKLSSSSNPYDYIKENPSYDELIRIGYDALPILEEELKNSNESGLREYIMCVAIEEIADCDLKQFRDSQWSSAENFKSKWDQYLKEVPVKVSNVLKSSKPSEVKGQEIAKLGAPAIPYVVQRADLTDKETNSKLTATLSRLIKDGKSAETLDEFRDNNGAIIQKLKKYVENR